MVRASPLLHRAHRDTHAAISPADGRWGPLPRRHGAARMAIPSPASIASIRATISRILACGDGRTSFDDRHLAPQPAEDLAELEPDVAPAHDHQVRRALRELQDRLVGQRLDGVEPADRRDKRASAGVEVHARRRHLRRRRSHDEVVAVTPFEGGVLADERQRGELGERALEPRSRIVHDLLRARHHRGEVDSHRPDVDAEVLRTDGPCAPCARWPATPWSGCIRRSRNSRPAFLPRRPPPAPRARRGRARAAGWPVPVPIRIASARSVRRDAPSPVRVTGRR